MKLEELKPDMRIRGILHGQTVTITSVKMTGRDAAKLVYRRADGKPGSRLVWRKDEDDLSVDPENLRFNFTRDFEGEEFLLAAEAFRIQLAHLFDPYAAVHSSHIDPLPHQIGAVYDRMLKQQPLRFLLADDPGAGKTIMAGLLLREMMARDLVSRCLICAPASLASQWKAEMRDKFDLEFHIFSEDTGRDAQALREHKLLIARMDQLKRDKYIKLLDEISEIGWDLIVIDEAHKMSARLGPGGRQGGKTARYRLGETLRERARHLLLLTATPHNGRNEDFWLFLRLLDRDRFAGQRERREDAGSLMRRMQKEEMRHFDGSKLFVSRYADTHDYRLDENERALYDQLTDYVRQEFNRAERLEGRQRNSIGFALTIMQRRLASSPRAIAKTLERRRDRLQETLDLARREGGLTPPVLWDSESLDDLDEGLREYVEEDEHKLSGSMTAANSIPELESEIKTVRALEIRAKELLESGIDRKWEQLAQLLDSDDGRLLGDDGRLHKLIIFTEFRDTLEYLVQRLGKHSGRPDSIVAIHGGIDFASRRVIQDRFRDDPTVDVLVATDAAGEGVNLQFANLMVNYDLPWNPNRIEQRFGRIHRIGQKKDCHLWNLISSDTREGAVFNTLLEKMHSISGALDGKVFDVLGEIFREEPLRKYILEAILASSHKAADQQRENLELRLERARKELTSREVLAPEVFAADQFRDMNIRYVRALAARLQPLHIEAFVKRVLETCGRRLDARKKGFFEIKKVPDQIRRASQRNLPDKYHTICFDPDLVRSQGETAPELLHPGHPLLRAMCNTLLKSPSRFLQRGAMLVDPREDRDNRPRLLLCFDQELCDALETEDGRQNVIERRLHCVEVDSGGCVRRAGDAPWINYRPLKPEEEASRKEYLEKDPTWLGVGQNEAIERAEEFVIENLIRPWLELVRDERRPEIGRQRDVIRNSLNSEIGEVKRRVADERHRIKNASNENERRLAQARYTQAEEELEDWKWRLTRRMQEMDRRADINAAASRIAGGALILPEHMLNGQPQPDQDARREVERLAIESVMNAECALGHEPHDVSVENLGYDIESRPTSRDTMRLIEVKGRRADARTVTLTRGEIMAALNSPNNYILALVEVENGVAAEPRYVAAGQVLEKPDAKAASVNYTLRKLLSQSTPPRRATRRAHPVRLRSAMQSRSLTVSGEGAMPAVSENNNTPGPDSRDTGPA